MKYFYLLVLLCIYQLGISQTATIRGYIRDKETGETLISASCNEVTTKKGVVANENGFFSISLRKGKVELQVNYIGYQTQTTVIVLKSDTIFDFSLLPLKYTVDEVVIRSERSIHEQTLLGKMELSPEKINAIPTFIGESDLLKAITSLPGISGGREGFSNIYVRGGDRGQNLILLDGAKLYNTSHLSGLVSLINTNMIKNVELYKGGFPASYGGRVSSIIDIHTLDGNRNKIQGKYNIGLLSSGLIIDGPISEKISFMLAARTSYYDLITIPSRIKYNQNKDLTKSGYTGFNGYTFFDVNAKLNYYATKGANYFINFFTGHDFYKRTDRSITSDQRFEDLSQMNIHNTCITLGNKYSPKPSLFWINRLTFSRYENAIKNDDIAVDNRFFNTRSKYLSVTNIEEVNLQSRLEVYRWNTNQIKIGIESSGYRFLPALQSNYEKNNRTQMELDTTIQSDLQTSLEVAMYAEDEIRFNKSLSLNAGLRGVAYFCNGTTYWRVEPRISLRAMLGKNLSCKANYTTMYQFNHVLVNQYGIFEKEIWMSSTSEIPPQKARQVAAGLFATIKPLKVELSVEAYYKRMNELLEYQAPASSESNPTKIEDDILKGGIGEAYGVECQLKYNGKLISGSINYTYSKNIRKFDELNNGKWYPFLYDRPHDLSVLLSLKLSKKLTFNSNFVYSTGTPFTMPEGFVKGDIYSFDYYAFSGKNNMRLPVYHRLDLSLVKSIKNKRGNMKQWSFNVFNAYARQNAVYIYNDRNTGKVYQKSMFSIIPTISYSCEF
jgi:hypothetical protein